MPLAAPSSGTFSPVWWGGLLGTCLSFISLFLFALVPGRTLVAFPDDRDVFFLSPPQVAYPF